MNNYLFDNFFVQFKELKKNDPSIAFDIPIQMEQSRRIKSLKTDDMISRDMLQHHALSKNNFDKHQIKIQVTRLADEIIKDKLYTTKNTESISRSISWSE